ncbi:MAG: UDP-N-acetylmuramoyl-tripeptide--D-alanyl-D-alanine ligase, partial [Myxococcales bacterium]|nr:UDP-N-acetylmuramoyl-tripeptide--D-alanyl-D-alanine ligase [Myxococcales bacterium]
MRYLPIELAQAAGGRLVRDAAREVSGVFLDSRSPIAGALFAPIVAARDGHAFLADAIRGGAAAVFVQRGRSIPDGDVSVIEVEDTTAALQRLGAARRE